MDSATFIDTLIDEVLDGKPLAPCLVQEMRAHAKLFDIIFPELSHSDNNNNNRPLPSFANTFLKDDDTATDPGS